MSEEQLDRREQLMAAMEAAEQGELEAPEEKEIHVAEKDPILEEISAEKSDKAESVKEDNEEPAEIVAEYQSEDSYEAAQEEDVKPVSRPSTWKKEYVQIWDKMEKGEQISKEDFVKFAEYANQRESEYKKGVSVYKAEADEAKAYKEAIVPYMPELQRQGISPATLIGNLTRAHMVLSTAPQEQKVQMIQRLAQDYGVQFNPNGQVQQLDPYAQQLMNQLQTVNQEVSVIKNRFAQEENQRLMNEIESFKSGGNAPHFDLVREEMAQLLELGKAQDLETAYAKAIRLNDEVWAIEQDRLLKNAQKQASKASQVAKAKAAAVSPKSAIPSGQVIATDKKDRRSILAEQVGDVHPARLVAFAELQPVGLVEQCRVEQHRAVAAMGHDDGPLP